ncbi:MAG: M1 family metallopeptidase [Xylanivirga thermophila]|jgi:hypothetical protein|uniref:M1 family metallopeptidase n=1 Tax=Xylanivirga thermophila TaxID=2496273 RepID=UPI00101CE948|nr:M1 family metallopeptidase [Xylanivirga thermophila]
MGDIRNNKILKRITIGFLVILVAALVGSAFNSQGLPHLILKDEQSKVLVQASEDLTEYKIDVYFDAMKKEIRCKQVVDYVNNTSKGLDKVYFHLYPNAFKDKNRSVYPEEEFYAAYPNGFSQGYIKFDDISINHVPAYFRIGGYSEELLIINLPTKLKPNDRIEITMEYEVKIPNSVGRFGYGEYTFNITNWYPIACVYDNKGWNTHPYYDIGDPFYSEVSNYDVIIHAPDKYTIATTGDIISIEEQKDKKLWHIKAMAVRDFAWVASNKFKISSKKVDGITVYSYYFDQAFGKEALDFALDAIGIYNKKFGKYPYKQFSVVAADFFIGGMEYPNLVLIDRTLYNMSSKDWLEIVTVHETAHQWWYGLVGNNQIEEPWLDEALAEYSTVLYYGHKYGADKMDNMYKTMITEGKYDYINQYIPGEKIDETIDRPVYKFPDWIIYDILVYGKGSIMLKEFHDKVGDKGFYNVLQTYYSDNMFKNVTKEDWLKACEKATNKSWNDFFDAWLYAK